MGTMSAKEMTPKHHSARLRIDYIAQSLELIVADCIENLERFAKEIEAILRPRERDGDQPHIVEGGQ